MKTIENQIDQMYDALRELAKEQKEYLQGTDRITEITDAPYAGTIQKDREGRPLLPDARASHWEKWIAYVTRPIKDRATQAEKEAGQIADWAVKAHGGPTYSPEELNYWAVLMRCQPGRLTREHMQHQAHEEILLYTTTWLRAMEDIERRKEKERSLETGLPKFSGFIHLAN